MDRVIRKLDKELEAVNVEMGEKLAGMILFFNQFNLLYIVYLENKWFFVYVNEILHNYSL